MPSLYVVGVIEISLLALVADRDSYNEGRFSAKSTVDEDPNCIRVFWDLNIMLEYIFTGQTPMS